jgi:hypothetical protein
LLPLRTIEDQAFVDECCERFNYSWPGSIGFDTEVLLVAVGGSKFQDLAEGKTHKSIDF